jgi:hypothetical protein
VSSRDGEAVSGRRLLPAIDADSRDYWDGAAQGQLLIRRCQACQRAHWYPRPHCPYCQADGTVWERSKGGGAIYTYTVIRQNSSSAFRDWVPYAIGLVDLDEGARVFARITGDIDAIQVGARVSVSFQDLDDVVLPAFVVGEGRHE